MIINNYNRRKKFALTKEMVKQKIRQVATRDRYSLSLFFIHVIIHLILVYISFRFLFYY